jgi:hypothetical protein
LKERTRNREKERERERERERKREGEREREGAKRVRAIGALAQLNMSKGVPSTRALLFNAVAHVCLRDRMPKGTRRKRDVFF